MKRIKAACLEQTVHFQLKDGISTEETRRQVREEYKSYRVKMDRARTLYKVLSEEEQPDGSLIIRIKKQFNTQPVGDYFG